jgi:DNA mismatch repair protein MutS
MNESVKISSTPLMRQYAEIKEQYPDTLLFFQVGDFYELFFDDAKKAAAFLGITLTARGKNNGEDVPLCGVPVHALDYYLAKLVKGGFRVALCDQLESPQAGKIVKRGVTQVLTPGTLTDTQLLENKSASYMLSFFPHQDRWGLVFGELLTAQLHATILTADHQHALEAELIRFFPDEVIMPAGDGCKQFNLFIARLGFCTTQYAVKDTDAAESTQWVTHQFRPDTAELYRQQQALQGSMTLFYSYLKRNQEAALAQFRHINFYQPDDFLILDRSTQRHLEMVKNSTDGTATHTLFDAVDGAVTAMGSRMIKKWLVRPLVKKEAIIQRQEAVGALQNDQMTCNAVRDCLKEIGDCERIIGRIALSKGVLNDYLALNQMLCVLPQLKKNLATFSSVALLSIIEQTISLFTELKNLLQASLNDDPTKDWLIKSQFDQQLDVMRELVEQSNEKILALERAEQEQTGINSLKIRYNQVHGYYIEITKANLGSVPTRYVRHQTLVGKERFTTPELKNLEIEIQSSRTTIDQCEQEIFNQIKKNVSESVGSLRKTAQAVAHLDALLGFAIIAYERGYIRPTIHEKNDIIIQQGKHPVVARLADHAFIPNDTQLIDDQRMWIITGPNMGGKSTYLRQVALLCILAQCGSFIPAQSAQLPILDRIFTRIGASDNVAQGKSTFLIEMEETALICKHATARSLLILDEVGRGTSTFDGLAIAQAVIEYIYHQIGARCLFATHYHELTQLADEFHGIVNYHAASKKITEKMLLLYRMVPGIADGSFGIEVARMAELPGPIITRSHELINQFQAASLTSVPESQNSELIARITRENERLAQALIALETKNKNENSIHRIMDEISWDDLSPKKAFDLLWQIKQIHLKKDVFPD